MRILSLALSCLACRGSSYYEEQQNVRSAVDKALISRSWVELEKLQSSTLREGGPLKALAMLMEACNQPTVGWHVAGNGSQVAVASRALPRIRLRRASATASASSDAEDEEAPGGERGNVEKNTDGEQKSPADTNVTKPANVVRLEEGLQKVKDMMMLVALEQEKISFAIKEDLDELEIKEQQLADELGIPVDELEDYLEDPPFDPDDDTEEDNWWYPVKKTPGDGADEDDSEGDDPPYTIR